MLNAGALPLVATPLERGDIALAFPLAQLMIRGLDLPKWRRLAGRLVTDGRVLKVNDERAYIRALSIFHTEEDEVGRKLVVDHGIALEMIARGEVGRALVAGLEEEARKLGCLAVHARIEAEQAELIEALRAAGHEHRMTLLCKPVGPCPSLVGPRATCQPRRCFTPRNG